MKYKVLFTRLFHLTVVLLSGLLITASPARVGAQNAVQAASPAAALAPVGTAFSFQGRLTDNGNPASGAYDFQFILYDAATGGSQQGATLTQAGITVSGGLFNVQLDFGQAVFNGEARFLEVGVKPAGAGSTYTVLLPRQALTAVPYALGMPGVMVQNGNVGIGMTDPNYKFSVNGNMLMKNGGGIYAAGTDFTFFADGDKDFKFLDSGGGLKMFIDAGSGNVGVGMTDPNYKFSVNGNMLMKNGGGIYAAGTDFTFYVDGTKKFNFADSGGNSKMVIDTGNGNVGIGTDNPQSKLHVAGDIRVSGGSFIDDGTALNVPDYVFEDDYDLMPLDELAAYLAREKHLPGVPSQDEIHRDGLNLSQFHMRLLEKVEELTLYTLAQQEQIDALEARLAALEQAP